MTLNSRDMFPFEKGVTMPHHEDDDLSREATHRTRRAHYASDAERKPSMPEMLGTFKEEPDALVGTDPPDHPDFTFYKYFEGKFGHLNFIRDIAVEDVNKLYVKDVQYGASWKKRGGVGAFMMLARKWDRLEEGVDTEQFKYDVFQFIMENPDRIDDIQDLRRYLLLVEAELRRQHEADLVGHD